MGTPRNPHQGQPVFVKGAPLDQAKATVVLLHGRGATAQSILTLISQIGEQPGISYLAPQAAMNAWYPQRFIAPIESNEPWLSSALTVVDVLLNKVEQAGIPRKKIMLMGFSQGSCLAVEYAARNPQKYGGVAVLSGGLIGPDGGLFDYQGSMDKTPIFLGCSDNDFHIPRKRVEDSAKILENLGAEVTTRLYPNMGHTINDDEIRVVRQMMQDMV